MSGVEASQVTSAEQDRRRSDDTGRFVGAIFLVAVGSAIAFNFALIASLPWWGFLALGLGWFEGLAAAAGVGVSGRLVLALFGTRVWQVWMMAIATLPGWIIAVALVRLYGTSLGEITLADAWGLAVAVVAAVGTGALARCWNARARAK
jgi:hypothetical protein